MATQTINTRIKNKVDSLASWQSYSGTLLDGEIALVRVPTGETFLNPVTGATEPVVELLMKVGDGGTEFAKLPWLSAKASDVYNWAKTPDVKDVEVTVITGSGDSATTAKKSFATWLSELYNNGATNAADISEAKAAILKLNGTDTEVGSVAKAVKDAIEALDYSDVEENSFVRTVVQEDGKIRVTYGKITEEDLPGISAAKIVVAVDDNSQEVHLDTRLAAVDADILELKNKNNGHTDKEIDDLIDAKLADLETVIDGEGSFVTAVSQEKGKVTVTMGDLPTLPAANAETAGIVKLGSTGGAATHDSIFGSDGMGGINAQIEANKSDIANLKTAVAGGVHFIGTVEAAPTSSAITVNGSTDTVIAVAGDIVIWAAEGIEYIYTGSAWEVLGDVDRVGAIETKIDEMDYDGGNFGTSKFVTKVTQTDGKIEATYGQAVSTDILYAAGGTDTIKDKIDDNAEKIAKKANSADVYIKTETDTAISTAINKLSFDAPEATDDATTSFIDSVSQTNGVITATKKVIASASTKAAGIVKLSSAIDSDSEELAATPKAVKSVKVTADDAASRVRKLEADYVRFNSNDNKLYIGLVGVDEIIFDCGKAE